MITPAASKFRIFRSRPISRLFFFFFLTAAASTLGKDISAERKKKFDFNASPSNQLFVMEFYLSWSLRDEKQAERKEGSEISMQKYLISQSNFL